MLKVSADKGKQIVSVLRNVATNLRNMYKTASVRTRYYINVNNLKKLLKNK